MTDEINDNDLQAFVDGQLDAGRLAEVETYLANNPKKQQMVADWQQQNEMIGVLYNLVAEESVPQRLQPVLLARRPGKRSPTWLLIAASVIIAVASGATGWFGRVVVLNEAPTLVAGLETPILVSEAIRAHAIYSVEVLHPVEVEAANQQHLVAWLSKRLGEKIVAPDLSNQGYSLVGGRLLPASDGPAAQFMYEDKAGIRITLYAARNASRDLASFQFANKNDLQAFYWLTPELSYALVGKIDRSMLQILAIEIYQQLT